jgi:C-22 sterol desaturase
MIIPSFWESTHDSTAYPEPEKFIPERWLPKEDGEQPLADKYPQNYMVWGSGPHKVSQREGSRVRGWQEEGG